jgi:Tol biopolymer transport system component
MEKFLKSKNKLHKDLLMLAWLIGVTIIFTPSMHAQAQVVYEKEGNIYIKDKTGKNKQLTNKNKDYESKLSPNRKQVIFIRAVNPCPFTEETGWLFSDFDEIWSMDIDGNNQHRIVENNYSEGMDMGNYIGSFGSLNFSPDGKYIYFLCQNCATDAILYKADADGSNIRKLSNAHQLDVIGGNPKDKYYGHLVAGKRKSSKGEAIKWTVVLLDSDGKEVEEIEDLEKFWLQCKKM